MPASLGRGFKSLPRYQPHTTTAPQKSAIFGLIRRGFRPAETGTKQRNTARTDAWTRGKSGDCVPRAFTGRRSAP